MSMGSGWIGVAEVREVKAISLKNSLLLKSYLIHSWCLAWECALVGERWIHPPLPPGPTWAAGTSPAWWRRCCKGGGQCRRWWEGLDCRVL